MTETAIFEEQNLGFSYLELFGVYGSAIKPPPFTLSLGETYNVVWDGVEHEVMAIDTSAVIPNSIAIGNGTNWGFPGNNGPFVIVYTADSDVSFISLTDTEPSTHAVAVYRKSEDTAIYTITHATLTAIADAIRAKTGGTDKILPGDMATAIEGITTGGGSSDDVRYVTFMNGDVVLYVKAVATGDDCVNVVAKGLVETPTKAPDEDKEYHYSGWSLTNGGSADSTALKEVTENRTVYAAYTTTNFTAYGNLSDSVKWSLNVNGILRIYGDGDIPSAASNSSLFKDYIASIKKVVIDKGITSIGANAFFNNTEITKVTLADTVTSIGNSAFIGCTSLTGITISDSMTSIGSYAFLGCKKLNNLIMPDSMTSIGSYAFTNCTKLTNVTFAVTSGWWVSTTETATSGTTLSATDLENTSTAATYLNSTYNTYYWKRT